MSSTTFEEKPYETASEFLGALRLSEPQWRERSRSNEEDVLDRAWARNWYFRGQCDADHPLLPRAWRKDDFWSVIESRARKNFERRINAELDNILTPRRELHSFIPLPQNLHRLAIFSVALHNCAEGMMVSEFLRLATDIGHHVPGAREWDTLSRHFVRNIVEELYGDGSDTMWRRPVVALAQHHGIATRLLDWTRNPLCAAYFAANEATEKPNSKKRIAVFAIHKALVTNTDIKLVTVPGSEIDFLRAQGGVFTLDSKGDEICISAGNYPSLEESVKVVLGEKPVPRPRKITLPQTKASDLLRLLWLEGVTQAHLMPTLDNVSAALKTKWRLVDKTN